VQVTEGKNRERKKKEVKAKLIALMSFCEVKFSSLGLGCKFVYVSDHHLLYSWAILWLMLGLLIFACPLSLHDLVLGQQIVYPAL